MPTPATNYSKFSKTSSFVLLRQNGSMFLRQNSTDHFLLESGGVRGTNYTKVSVNPTNYTPL